MAYKLQNYHNSKHNYLGENKVKIIYCKVVDKKIYLQNLADTAVLANLKNDARIYVTAHGYEPERKNNCNFLTTSNKSGEFKIDTLAEFIALNCPQLTATTNPIHPVRISTLICYAGQGYQNDLQYSAAYVLYKALQKRGIWSSVAGRTGAIFVRPIPYIGKTKSTSFWGIKYADSKITFTSRSGKDIYYYDSEQKKTLVEYLDTILLERFFNIMETCPTENRLELSLIKTTGSQINQLKNEQIHFSQGEVKESLEHYMHKIPPVKFNSFKESVIRMLQFLLVSLGSREKTDFSTLAIQKISQLIIDIKAIKK